MASSIFHAYQIVVENFLMVYSSMSELLPCKKKILHGKKIKVPENNVDHQRWDDELLKDNILEEIMDRMNLVDCIRASNVSKCWRSAALQRKHDIKTAQVPWLLLFHNQPRIKTLQFFDLSSSSFYNISLPKILLGWRYIGSSKGWLVIAKKYWFINPPVVLFNPISGVQIQLPPVETIPSFENIMKIQVSSADASNCVVAASFYDGTTIALCRAEDKSWSIFEEIDQRQYDCEDILFYNGILYALMRKRDEVDVNAAFAPTYSMRIGDAENEVVIKPIPLDNPNPLMGVPMDESEEFLIVKNGVISSYLVEDNGELLIVHRIMDVMGPATDVPDILVKLLKIQFLIMMMVTLVMWDYLFKYVIKLLIMTMVTLVMFMLDSPCFALFMVMIACIYFENHNGNENRGDYEYSQTSKFEVFKIDDPSGDNIISNVTRVCSLGDRMLFLSKFGSVSVQVSKRNQWKRNCIFFVEDDHNSMRISRESGVFYLEDERIQRCFPSIHDITWFSPNL